MSIVNDYKYKKDLKVTSQNDANTTINKALPLIAVDEGYGPQTFRETVKDVSGETSNPTGFTEKNGNFFISAGDTVYEYDSNWNFVTSYSISGQTLDAQGITVGANGNFYVADSENTNIREYDSTFTVQNSYDVSSEVTSLIDVHQRDDDNHWYVFDNNDNLAYEYDTNWNYQTNAEIYGDVISSGSNQGSGNYQGFFEVDGGSWWVVDTGNANIFEMSARFNTLAETYDISSENSAPNDLIRPSADEFLIMDETDLDISKYNGTQDSTTGTGNIVLNWSDISGAEDIAIADQYGNILDYELERIDTSGNRLLVWLYESYIRDDSVQPQILYANNTNNLDRQDAQATWDNSSQQVEMVQHFNGDANDSTPNNYDGTNNDAFITTGTDLFAGNASFSGSDNVEFSNSNLLSDAGDKGSISFWVYFREVSSTYHIFDSDTSGSNRYRLTYDGANTEYQLEINGTVVKKYSTTPSTNTWYHIVVSWDTVNETYKFFENSSSVGTTPNTGVTSSNPDNFYIGSDYTQSVGLDGNIDEFKVYNKILSAEEVQAEYDASPENNQILFNQQSGTKHNQSNETTSLNDSNNILAGINNSENVTAADTTKLETSLKLVQKFSLSDLESLKNIKNISETTTLQETIEKQTTFLRDITQPATLSDTLNTQPEKTVQQNLSLNDAASTLRIKSASPTETIQTNTATTKKILQQKTFSLQILESDIQQTEKTLAANINTSDVEKTRPIKNPQENLNLNENISTIDLQKKLKPFIQTTDNQSSITSKSFAEQTSITSEQVSKPVKKLSETIKTSLDRSLKLLAEKTQELILNTETSSESALKLAEPLSAVDTTLAKTVKVLTQKTQLKEFSEKTAELSRTPTETLKTVDKNKNKLAKTLSETQTINESLKRLIDKNILETANLDDALDKLATKSRRETGLNEPNQVEPVARTYNEAEKL